MTDRSSTPIIGHQAGSSDYVVECYKCGCDVDMKCLIIDSGKDLDRVRGFVGVCGNCKAQTMDEATVELLENMGVLSRMDGLQ